MQITEHTEYNYMTAALYCVGEELENLMRTDRQTENSITEATLIPMDRRGEQANREHPQQAKRRALQARGGLVKKSCRQ